MEISKLLDEGTRIEMLACPSSLCQKPLIPISELYGAFLNFVANWCGLFGFLPWPFHTWE